MKPTRVEQIAALEQGETYSHMVELEGANQVDYVIGRMKRNSAGTVGKAVQRVEARHPERKFETHNIVTATTGNRLFVGTLVQRVL